MTTNTSIYLNYCIPQKVNSKVSVDFDLRKKVSELRVVAESMLELKSEDNECHIELVFRGTILDNDNTLEEHNIENGNIIYVFNKHQEKNISTKVAEMKVTDDEIKKAISAYRRLIIYLNGTSLTRMVRPDIIKKVIQEYPEFKYDLGAFAILIDPFLLTLMQNFYTCYNIAKTYPILIKSAEFATKCMSDNLDPKWVTDMQQNNLSILATHEESTSDSSISSDGGDPSASTSTTTGTTSSPGTQNRPSLLRRISRNQLATALSMAGSSSTNSLANIAASDLMAATSNSPSTSSSSSLSTTFATPINRSSFEQALSDAIMSTTMNQLNPQLTSVQQTTTATNTTSSATATTADVTASSNPPMSAPPRNQNTVNAHERYSNELITMQEMGLTDESANLNALIISNGNVEAAINLVLSNYHVF